MKLFKEAHGVWAARCHLIYDMDLDIEVRFYNVVSVCINIIDSSCKEGMIINKQLDGVFVRFFAGDLQYFHGHIENGQFKQTSRDDALPTAIRFCDIDKTIQLEYET